MRAQRYLLTSRERDRSDALQERACASRAGPATAAVADLVTVQKLGNRFEVRGAIVRMSRA
jgi:hypothetical protein